VEGVATIEVTDNGLFLVATDVDWAALSNDALIYRFDGRDYLVFDGEPWEIKNSTSFPSRWRVKTFLELSESLEHYQTAVSPTCRCPFLESVWYDSDRRWILKNKPEETFQRSVEQHLINGLRLGRVEIRREQPIQATKPPDIKVTWSEKNRLAFVEVKWMGASAHATEARISWAPDEREANKGAKQLADYLALNAAEAPEQQAMGFLVVFDARREGLEFATTTLTRADAMHYAARDVVFDPDYSAIRHDFAPPVRCFLLPLQPAA
jgi:hypothetical protein